MEMNLRLTGLNLPWQVKQRHRSIKHDSMHGSMIKKSMSHEPKRKVSNAK